MNGNSKDSEVVGKDTYYLLGEINGKLDSLINQQSKVILALIALAGATIGLKLVGTPPIQVIMYYIKAFVLFFAILISFAKRRSLKGWTYLFTFGLSAGVAQVMNIVSNGEASIATGLYLVSNVSLLLFVWGRDDWDKTSKLEKGDAGSRTEVAI